MFCVWHQFCAVFIGLYLTRRTAQRWGILPASGKEGAWSSQILIVFLPKRGDVHFSSIPDAAEVRKRLAVVCRINWIISAQSRCCQPNGKLDEAPICASLMEYSSGKTFVYFWFQGFFNTIIELLNAFYWIVACSWMQVPYLNGQIRLWCNSCVRNSVFGVLPNILCFAFSFVFFFGSKQEAEPTVFPLNFIRQPSQCAFAEILRMFFIIQ